MSITALTAGTKLAVRLGIAGYDERQTCRVREEQT